ncbi:hypothetical protein AGABI1DRAFT_112264 [Agaricus bisporus var. burnettii JB137-S8]|uniref:Uncharacterized protein n=1 Tax=Agaricus bisporus var. burnettii (strain JB137-S8 / ATCC MYA-4627 / FGSC 10392) TaxID=597362 RepID=K5Y2Q4_AGABU|nr:uncharacterized protein AGABI1DRAFT_112264 [Agaricus bisporus var. burnettii JB137-S8]EKM82160.1 hypothetical protein AGABI1DRAFT_112264 [Agaricus bisporus var. burnettii JB137-S8]
MKGNQINIIRTHPIPSHKQHPTLSTSSLRVVTRFATAKSKGSIVITRVEHCQSCCSSSVGPDFQAMTCSSPNDVPMRQGRYGSNAG